MDKMKQMMDEFWLYFQPNIFSMPRFLHTMFGPMQRVTLSSGQSARMRSQQNLWTLQGSYDHSRSLLFTVCSLVYQFPPDSWFRFSTMHYFHFCGIFYLFFHSRKSQISRRSLQLKTFIWTQTRNAKKINDFSATSTNPTPLYISLVFYCKV